MLYLLKIKLTKSILTNIFLTEIYNFILIYVPFCILINALFLQFFFLLIDYLGFYIYFCKYTIISN